MTEIDKDVSEVVALYHQLIGCWNSLDGRAMAALYSERGNLVGFDGSQVNGRDEIDSHLSGIFANHHPATFVVIVREIRIIAKNTALLSAAAGMVQPGGQEIMPQVNAVQSLVMSRAGDRWQIELFQNTPAAWHGRPDDIKHLTVELQAAISGQ